MKKFALGFVSAFVFLGLVAAVAAWRIDVAAVSKPGLMEGRLAWISAHAIHRHAAATKNPFAGDAAAAAIGLDHYRENCLLCHGAPGIPPGELASGLHPPAPDLASKDAQAFDDSELFWITANGVMMTGMPGFRPTHEDAELWHVVTFLRHLPNLTPEEVAALKGSVAEGAPPHHHHDATSAENPAPSAPGAASAGIAGHVATLEVTDDSVHVRVTEKNGAAPDEIASPTLTLEADGKIQKVMLEGRGGDYRGRADLKGVKRIVATFGVNLDGKPASTKIPLTRP